MTADLKTRLVLDTTKADRSAEKFGNKIKTETKQAAEDVDKELRTWRERLEDAANSATVMNQKLQFVKTSVNIVLGSIREAGQALPNLFGEAQGLYDSIAQIRLFKGDIADIDVIRGKLDDVKNRIEAASLVSLLSRGGFDSSQIEAYAAAVNLIAARSGVAKDAVEQMLQAGQLSQDALASIGKSKEEAAAIIAEAEAAAGRPLDNLERSQALLNAWGEEIKKAEGALGQFGQSNPFDVLQKDIESAWQVAKKALFPAIAEIGKEFKKMVPTIKAWAKAGATAIKDMVDFFRQYMIPVIDAVISGFRVLGKVAAGVAAIITFQWSKASAILKETAGDIVKGLGLVEKTQLEMYRRYKRVDDPYGIKANMAYVKKEQEALDKRRRLREREENKADLQRRRRLAQFRAESLREIISAQQAFRQMQRDRDTAILGAITASGGPASAAIGAINTALQKVRQLRLAGAQNTKLGQQLISLYQKAGTDALAKFVDKQLQFNETLKAQNGLYAEEKQLAALRAARLKNEAKINASINQLQETSNYLRSRGIKQYANEIKFVEDNIKVLVNARKERERLFVIRQRQIKANADYAKTLEQLNREQARRSGRNAVVDIYNQIAALKGLDTIEGERLQNARQQRDLDLQRRTILAKIKQLEALQPLDSPRERQRLQRDIDGLKEQVTLIETQKKAIDDLTEAQERAATVGGAALNSLTMQAVDAAKKIGDAVGSSVTSLVQGLGTAIAGLFEGLVKGEKDVAATFGAAILSALGDMAIAFASTFAGIAVGRFALGDVAGGLALTGAATALYAAAGFIKGLGAVVTASSAPSASSTSSAPQPTLPGQETRAMSTDPRVTNIYVAGFLGSDAELYRRMKQVEKRGQRAVGAR